MLRLLVLSACLSILFQFNSVCQTQNPSDTCKAQMVKGFHIGVVQPLFAIHKNTMDFVNEYDFYSIGFPFGITLKTSGKLLIDLELVPFIKPYINDDSKPYAVSLLYHPGVLMPLRHKFTVGLRAAFEPGNNQFGFTPLINKGFKLNHETTFFVELVFPGRFGPEKSSGYTQVAGLHVGLGF